MPEKRNHKRKISRIPVKFGIDAYDKTSYTSNFSTHGFFLRTNRPFVAGTELQFEFRLAGGEVFYVRGQVMHSKRIPSQYARVKRGGMGIKISAETKDEKEGYSELLKCLKIIE